VPDFATAAASAMHRRLGRPGLVYTPLHALEVPNTLRTRVFAAGHAARRAAAKRERDTGLRRLAHYLTIGCFVRKKFDWDEAVAMAERLSESHAESLGPRALDMLHVAAAALLRADRFLTCDGRQARLANGAGLNVELVDAGS